MLVDSHCHLNMLQEDITEAQINVVLEAAKEKGVAYFLCVCVDLEHFPEILAIAEKYSHVYATFGLHPNEQVVHEPDQEMLIERARHSKVIGIGETGLDYYRSSGDLTWQQDRFRCHINTAKALNKPLIIHSRMAREDTIRILREEQADRVGGIMHCFAEDWHTAKLAMDLGFYISFSGIVTFKNAQELKQVAKQVPLDKMLIETDAPFLAPVPFRGKPNQPAYVRYVAEHIAELRGITFEEVAQATTNNFFRLFQSQINSII